MNNWRLLKLGDICHFVRGPFGGSLKKSIFKDKGIAVYEQQHAIYDQFDNVRYFIDEKKFNEMKRFEVKPGDVVMSCSGTMGKTAIVPEGVKKGIINQALLKITPSEKILCKYLKLWMESDIFQKNLQSKGAAIKNVVSVKILKEMQINLPPISEQKRLVALLDELFKKLGNAKENAEKQLLQYDNLEKSILNQAFTGKL